MDLWFKCTIVIITAEASFSVMTHCDKVCVWSLQVKRKAISLSEKLFFLPSSHVDKKEIAMNSVIDFKH